MTPALSIRNVSKSFGSHRAVNAASFEVPFGAVTGFVGANGSGKTTTMRMIVGLTQPTAGEIVVDGTTFDALTEPRRTVGAVLDRIGAHPGLSGNQYLKILTTSAGFEQGLIAPVLERVGLADAADRRLGTYSTGMKQRLALAGALLGDPKILILDEPASGLDPAGIRWLRGLLSDLASQGRAVFVSTHQLAELSTIVDRVVLIDEGQIRAEEPTVDLLRRTGQEQLEDAIFSVLAPETPEVVR